MPIIATDIKVRTSTVAGAAGNANAQATPGNSLGKYMSTTDIVDAVLNNLFPDMTGDENAASNVDYQCLFIWNNHASLTYQNVVVWCSAEVAGGANTSIGIDTTAASSNTSAAAQAVTIANKNTAPAGVAFTLATAANSKANGLSLGSLAPGQVRAVWVRRTATNSAALNSDGVTLAIAGDTAA
jgi:hypothetical protein